MLQHSNLESAPVPGPRDRQVRLRASTLAVAMYWFALLAGTHWPRQFLPRENLLFSKDKLLHFSAYAGLTFLLLNAVRLRRRVRPASAAAAFGQAALVCLVVSASGLLDEITQPLVGRDFEWYDWLADSTGSICGALLASVLLRRFWMTHAEEVGASCDAAESRPRRCASGFPSGVRARRASVPTPVQIRPGRRSRRPAMWRAKRRPIRQRRNPPARPSTVHCPRHSVLPGVRPRAPDHRRGRGQGGQTRRDHQCRGQARCGHLPQARRRTVACACRIKQVRSDAHQKSDDSARNRALRRFR